MVDDDNEKRQNDNKINGISRRKNVAIVIKKAFILS
jgi:hypothetical protein